jgi:capsular exopolysaccharide synthesis family protein
MQIEPHTNPNITASNKEEEGFNFQKLINQLLYYWWLFALSAALAFMAVFLYLRYTTPVFVINAKILVKDAKKGGNMGQSEIFEDFGLLNNNNSVENEVELLKSRTLMQKTVESQQLNFSYFASGKVKQTEVFESKLPFELVAHEMIEDSLAKSKTLFFKYIDNKKFELETGTKSQVYRYADTVNLSYGRMIFYPKKSEVTINNTDIRISLIKVDDAVASFSKKLTIGVTNKAVSTIELTIKDAVPERGELLLNTLITIYNRMNIEDKNKIADSTISFIDNRLTYVSGDLGQVEQNIQTFRQENRLTDLSTQGKIMLENTAESTNQAAQQEVQIAIINSLENYLRKQENSSRTIPAGLVISDPTFASSVQTYNTLQLEKERQLQTTTENNPIVQRIDAQLTSLRADILANLTTIRRTLSITLSQLRRRGSNVERQLQQVPGKERVSLELGRQQKIKEELFLYLLKKREETAVSKAANLETARVVDAAKSDRVPVSPKRSVLYLSAFFLGIILPSLILYIRDLLNNKVESKKDITSITQVPIIGEIGRSQFKHNFFISDNIRHPITEQLRQLRTNLEFMQSDHNGKGKVLLLTSNMTGEGKSFLAMNLAGLLAYGGKKVILLEFDLRKPKLTSSLGMENNDGISNFLINKVDIVGKLVKPIKEMAGLFLLSSGPIPPNPAELINSDRTNELYNQLKEEFDYIITDAPPIGVVTDAQLLAPYAHNTLFVVRQGYTYKNQIDLVNELYINNKFPNLGIVVNDIKKQSGYGYGYGYAYGYGYGTGYLEK